MLLDAPSFLKCSVELHPPSCAMKLARSAARSSTRIDSRSACHKLLAYIDLNGVQNHDPKLGLKKRARFTFRVRLKGVRMTSERFIEIFCISSTNQKSTAYDEITTVNRLDYVQRKLERSRMPITDSAERRRMRKRWKWEDLR